MTSIQKPKYSKKHFICSKDFSKLPFPTDAKGDKTSQVIAGIPLKLHTSSTAPLYCEPAKLYVIISLPTVFDIYCAIKTLDSF